MLMKVGAKKIRFYVAGDNLHDANVYPYVERRVVPLKQLLFKIYSSVVKNFKQMTFR